MVWFNWYEGVGLRFYLVFCFFRFVKLIDMCLLGRSGGLAMSCAVVVGSKEKEGGC